MDETLSFCLGETKVLRKYLGGFLWCFFLVFFFLVGFAGRVENYRASPCVLLNWYHCESVTNYLGNWWLWEWLFTQCECSSHWGGFVLLLFFSSTENFTSCCYLQSRNWNLPWTLCHWQGIWKGHKLGGWVPESHFQADSLLSALWTACMGIHPVRRKMMTSCGSSACLFFVHPLCCACWRAGQCWHTKVWVWCLLAMVWHSLKAELSACAAWKPDQKPQLSHDDKVPVFQVGLKDESQRTSLALIFHKMGDRSLKKISIFYIFERNVYFFQVLLKGCFFSDTVDKYVPPIMTSKKNMLNKTNHLGKNGLRAWRTIKPFSKVLPTIQ